MQLFDFRIMKNSLYLDLKSRRKWEWKNLGGLFCQTVVRTERVLKAFYLVEPLALKN